MVPRILSEIGLFRMSRDYSKSPEFLSTLERGLAVLKSFAGQAKSMTLSQVAERTALSPAVVRRCLLTLEHLGYVSKMDGRFALSPGVLSFASLFNEAYNLDGTIRPILQRLRDETGDSASFTVIQNADVLYVSHSSAQRAIRLQANTGTRYPALVTSTGRAMLADLSDEDLHEFIRRNPVERYTAKTIIDPDELFNEIRECGRRGYALVSDELDYGITSMAAPVSISGQGVVGAINSSAQTQRVDFSTFADQRWPLLDAAAHDLRRTLTTTPDLLAVLN
ncbi:IclR family transcriptional regulator C-terminal domain-containing protein [Luminiphilus sp.]|jgi:IclR family pca regulon transcriptional regulator|nr:IclR family transcriptional regulator C-terminal domain-containing protein [Luminiphilus sp.]